MKLWTKAINRTPVALVLVWSWTTGCNQPLQSTSSVSAGERPSSVARPRLSRPSAQWPDGQHIWRRRGSKPSSYQGTVVETVGLDRADVSLRSRSRWTRGFGTYMTSIDAEPYRGRRVRIRATIDTERVRGWVGLWMRVDRDDQPIGFDNMHRDRLRGTLSNQRCEVVLDVEADADVIAYGILLSGAGSVEADDLTFDVVDATVVPTDGGLRPHCQTVVTPR